MGVRVGARWGVFDPDEWLLGALIAFLGQEGLLYEVW